MRTIEDFRDTAHNGAEIKNPFTIDTVNDAQHWLFIQNASADAVLLSEEGLRQFGILGQFGELHTETKPEFRTVFNLVHEKKKQANGYIGSLLGMDVYTDYFLEPSKRFITGAGRILPFPTGEKNG